MSTTREFEARLGALRLPAGAVPTGATCVMLLSILISFGVLLAVPVPQAPVAPAVLILGLWLGGMAGPSDGPEPCNATSARPGSAHSTYWTLSAWPLNSLQQRPA